MGFAHFMPVGRIVVSVVASIFLPVSVGQTSDVLNAC